MNEGEILGHVPGPEEYEEFVELYEAVKRRNPQSNPPLLGMGDVPARVYIRKTCGT